MPDPQLPEINENELNALVSLLDDEDHEVLNHVEQKLIALGDKVIPILEKAWESQFNPLVQRRIEELIHTLHFESVQNRLLFWSSSGAKDLMEGLWIIATYQYPDLNLQDIRQRMDEFIELAKKDFDPKLTPREQVMHLNEVIFSTLRFSANTKNFHSPSNSMIHLVLESRKGNPIALCVVYMAVAQALGMPVYGVNLPNLFILTYSNEASQFYINAFNKGLIFTKSDIDNYLQHLKLNPIDTFYQPCSHQDIVMRVLRNLTASFEKTGQQEKVQEVEQMIKTLEKG